MKLLITAILCVTICLGCQTINNNTALQIHMGEMTFDVETDCFEAKLTLNNKSRTLSICDLNKTESKKAKELGNKLKDWLANNLDKSKEYAATKLLKLKNENWLDENESPITQIAFMETIEFEGVNAFAEGGFEIYFNDHNLFGGHTIVVDVKKGLEFDGANVSG